MFPGDTDRDPEYVGYVEPNVEYLIDSVNPLSWSRAVHRIVLFDPDVVVIPWWTIYWVPCFGFIARRLRRQGITVVFFCHNVIEHEAAAWKTVSGKFVLGVGDRFVVHTKEDAENLLSLYPKAEVAIHPHPIYHHFPAPKDSLAPRGALEILFYGFVRPYKGLDVLIDAMSVVGDPAIRLTIAGEFWGGEEATYARLRALGLSEQVEVRAYYHTDCDTAEVFARADVVVLPYRSATGSGVVPVAYHYDKPVIVTKVGGLPDVVVEGSTGFVVPKDDVGALAQVLRGLSRAHCADMAPAISEYKKTLTWENLAALLVDGDE